VEAQGRLRQTTLANTLLHTQWACCIKAPTGIVGGIYGAVRLIWAEVLGCRGTRKWRAMPSAAHAPAAFQAQRLPPHLACLHASPQASAVHASLGRVLSLWQGPPGSGKTRTLLRCVWGRVRTLHAPCPTGCSVPVQALEKVHASCCTKVLACKCRRAGGCTAVLVLKSMCSLSLHA